MPVEPWYSTSGCLVWTITYWCCGREVDVGLGDVAMARRVSGTSSTRKGGSPPTAALPLPFDCATTAP